MQLADVTANTVMSLHYLVNYWTLFGVVFVTVSGDDVSVVERVARCVLQLLHLQARSGAAAIHGSVNYSQVT